MPAPIPQPGLEAALTPAQVREQVAAARLLRAQLSVSDARLSAAITALGTLSSQVAAALERQQAADQASAAAQQLATAQLSRLINLHVKREQGQAYLGRWAREAYTTGGPLAAFESWITALEGKSTNDVAHDLALLQHVGVVSSTTLTELTNAGAAQQVITATATRSAAAAQTASVDATAARAKADALLKQQRRVLAGLQAAELRAVGRAQLTSTQLSRSRGAAAIAAQAQLAVILAARSAGQPAPLNPDDCQGLSTLGYPNGEIPTAALCPLWGAPGLVLRADAAAAFRDLSKSYAAEFGRPICVTDAYRTRSQQVTVFAQRPTLAARPGTSNHGLGLATDMCGGVESFATVEHAWLLAHAGLFGWFHPSWAEPGGPKPEPWHWEFAG